MDECTVLGRDAPTFFAAAQDAHGSRRFSQLCPGLFFVMAITGRECACVYHLTVAFGHRIDTGEQQ